MIRKNGNSKPLYILQVHSLQVKCSRTVVGSCNCGMLVQSGDDVIRIDRCPKRGWSNSGERPLQVFAFINGDLTEGTQIISVQDGLKYKVGLIFSIFVVT